MVLLDRIRSDEQAAEELRGGPLPRTESLGLVEALTHLAPQTSALSRTPGGLGRLAREVQRVGVHRLVYREIEAEGISGHGIDNDVTEGLVAFQLSIKPEW